MKIQQRSGPGLVCPVILVAIAIIAIAGCVDSTHNQQGLVTPTGTRQSETPAVTTTVTIMTPPAPTPQKSLARPATGSSDGVIRLDPFGVIYAGEDYVITGTTSLPVGTDLILQMRPDDGTTPTGYDTEAGGSCEGTASIRAGNGTVNRIVFEGSITPGDERGKWVAVAGNGIGNGHDFEMGTHIGYAYFTME
ncbi:hypothetical protein [Methanoregula sp.]|uniref:hypothetical protein n=1 Tax=Methanoregula sp. TaxID=2052170 RepID=UPI003BAE92D5